MVTPWVTRWLNWSNTSTASTQCNSSKCRVKSDLTLSLFLVELHILMHILFTISPWVRLLSSGKADVPSTRAHSSPRLITVLFAEILPEKECSWCMKIFTLYQWAQASRHDTNMSEATSFSRHHDLIKNLESFDAFLSLIPRLYHHKLIVYFSILSEKYFITGENMFPILELLWDSTNIWHLTFQSA